MIRPDHGWVSRENARLDESHRCRWMLSQTDWLALLDVTVSRTRPGWLDPDGYKLTCLVGCVGSQSQRFLKSCLVGNDVIGGKNEHCGCMIAGNDPTRAERDRGGGVAFGRFSDDVLFWKTTKQFAHCAFLFGVCQDQSTFRRDKAFKSPQRFLRAESCRKRGAAVVWGGHAGSMAKSVHRCRRRE